MSADFGTRNFTAYYHHDKGFFHVVPNSDPASGGQSWTPAEVSELAEIAADFARGQGGKKIFTIEVGVDFRLLRADPAAVLEEDLVSDLKDAVESAIRQHHLDYTDPGIESRKWNDD